MDYTAILSRLDSVFSGTSGVLLIALIGVLGIIGVHILRMKYARTRPDRKSKTYRNVVIEPYVDEEGRDPLDAMMPKFSANQEQF